MRERGKMTMRANKERQDQLSNRLNIPTQYTPYNNFIHKKHYTHPFYVQISRKGVKYEGLKFG